MVDTLKASKTALSFYKSLQCKREIDGVLVSCCSNKLSQAYLLKIIQIYHLKVLNQKSFTSLVSSFSQPLVAVFVYLMSK